MMADQCDISRMTPDKWFAEKDAELKSLNAEWLHTKFQEKKRFDGFFWLDRLLAECSQETCPIGLFVPALLWVLSDISLEGYIAEKVKQLDNDQRWRDKSEGDRKRVAIHNIDRVLKCRKRPRLGKELLAIDTAEVFEPTASYYEAARKRKAYWTYLKYGRNDSAANYFRACDFITQIHDLGNRTRITGGDVKEAWELIVGNMDIANAVDLFRLCALRQNAKCGSGTLEVGRSLDYKLVLDKPIAIMS